MSLHDCGIADYVYRNVIGAALCSPSGVFLNCGVSCYRRMQDIGCWRAVILVVQLSRAASTILAKRGTARGTCGDYHMFRTSLHFKSCPSPSAIALLPPILSL